MQAIRYHRYGGPEALALEDVETPVAGRRPGARAGARGVGQRRRLARAARAPVPGPRDRRPAPAARRRPRRATSPGVVEAVGEAVTRFQPGDEVFGMTHPLVRRVACRARGRLVAKPANVSFEQAGGDPRRRDHGAPGPRDKGRIREGSRVLVNGAGGGVGSFAVQIAKAFGAHVTAVTSPDDRRAGPVEGADEVDRLHGDRLHAPGDRQYDLMFDTGGNRSFRDCARAMAPDGVLVICGAPKGNWLAPILRPTMGALRSRVGEPAPSPRSWPTGRPRTSRRSRELAEAGKLRPVIERTYALAEVPDAIASDRDRPRPGQARGGGLRPSPTRPTAAAPAGRGRRGPGPPTPARSARHGRPRGPATHTARGPRPGSPRERASSVRP